MLIRPQPERGESWPGYLLRLAGLNHLDRGIQHFADQLGITAEALVGSDPEAALKELQLATSEKGRHLPSKPDVKRTSLWSSMRSVATRICPQCLDEMKTKYVLASWDRAFQFECLTHHLLLIESCPQCGAQITHLRKHLLRCNCNASLLTLPRQWCTESNAAIYKILDLNDAYACDAETFAASKSCDRSALLFCKRLKITQALLKSEVNTRNAGQFADVFVTTEEWTEIRNFFHGWPESLYRLLQRIRDQRDELPSKYLTAKPLTKKCLPHVRSVVREWSLHRNRTLKSGKLVPALVQKMSRKTVGIKYLIEATGCTYGIAQYWLERGWLGAFKTEKQPSGFHRYSIDLEKVQKAIQIVKSTSSTKEVARSLGLPMNAIRALIRAKVFAAIPYGRGRFNVRLQPQEVFGFADSLLKCAQAKRKVGGDQISLARAIEGFRWCPTSDLEAFLNSVLTGEIPVNKCDSYVVRLDELLIDAQALKEWKKSFK